jgi:hypothetical protein
MAGNEILMDEDAELGPIDPQMLTANGLAPAEAIRDQFQKASDDILSDPRKLSIWIPILQPMGPSLLVQCNNAIQLSKQLVTEWLTRYMYQNAPDAAGKASKVAEFLGKHSEFKSHARRVKLEQLKREEPALNILNLREDPNLYSRVWEIYCVMDLIFVNTPIYKLFYNSSDDAMVRLAAQVVQQIVAGPPLPPPPAPQSP